WHPRNLGIRETLASEKPWHPRNLGIPETLASEKPWIESFRISSGLGLFWLPDA
ncbi:MAG: hypothetical protein ACI814_004711, partial [Mariniblastus sp.]